MVGLNPLSAACSILHLTIISIFLLTNEPGVKPAPNAFDDNIDPLGRRFDFLGNYRID